MKAEVLFFYKNKLGPREENKKWYKSECKKKKSQALEENCFNVSKCSIYNFERVTQSTIYLLHQCWSVHLSNVC